MTIQFSSFNYEIVYLQALSIS